MSHRYEFARAAGEKNLMLIFPEGAFESLPFEIRLAAPWTGHGYGKITELKPFDRRQLLEVGYAILRQVTVATTVSETAASRAMSDKTAHFRQAA
jgi:hypothetical protein